MRPKRIIPCEFCGAQFTAERLSNRFCSTSCSKRSRAPLVPVTCDNCGKPFEAQPWRIRKHRTHYCGQSCRTSAAGTVKDRLLRNRDIDPVTGCWNWTKGLGSSGYGRTKIDGRAYGTHRLSAHLYLGHPLDSPLLVLHRCDNPRCFNPDHLFIGTQADNTADMYAKGRACVGSRKADAKLTEADIPRIRERIDNAEPKAKIAADYGVSPGAIWHIAVGRSWKHA